MPEGSTPKHVPPGSALAVVALILCGIPVVLVVHALAQGGNLGRAFLLYPLETSMHAFCALYILMWLVAAWTAPKLVHKGIAWAAAVVAGLSILGALGQAAVRVSKGEAPVAAEQSTPEKREEGADPPETLENEEQPRKKLSQIAPDKAYTTGLISGGGE